jgi:ribosomal protein L29
MASIKKTAKVVKKTAEIKTVVQMRSDLSDKQNDLIGYKKGHKMGELTNPRVITSTRKEIARLKTAIRAAELKEDK